MTEDPSQSETGTRTADRNNYVANWFSIARAVWDMHDSLITEQRRTNQLLEALIDMQRGTVPAAMEPPPPADRHDIQSEHQFDDLGNVIPKNLWR